MSEGTATKGKLSASLAAAQEAIAKRKLKTAVAEPKAETRTGTDEQLDESKFANIGTNTFHKILLDPNLSEEERLAQARAALKPDVENEEQTKERLNEFVQFMEFVHLERKKAALELTRSTDPAAVAALQSVLEKIGGGLLMFEEMLQPFIDDLNAFHEFRMAGETFDVYKQILEEDKAKKKGAADYAAREAQVREIEGTIDGLASDITSLKSEKKFFGRWGGPSAETLEKVEDKEREAREARERISTLRAEMDSLQQEVVAEDTDRNRKKERIRALMNTPKEELIGRSQKFVDTVVGFVLSSDKEVNAVLESVTRLNGQLDKMYRNNSGMQGVVAIASDAVAGANEDSLAIRNELGTAPEGESVTKRVSRESRLRGVDEHINQLSLAEVDATRTLEGLTKQALGITAARQENQQRITNTNILYNSGISTMSEQLLASLTALSGAAIHEAMETAKAGVRRVGENTDKVLSNQVVQNAMGLHEMGAELAEAASGMEEKFQALEQVVAMSREGTSSIREGIARVRAANDRLKSRTDELLSTSTDALQSAFREANAAAEPEAAAAAPKPASPFAAIRR